VSGEATKGPRMGARASVPEASDAPVIVKGENEANANNLDSIKPQEDPTTGAVEERKPMNGDKTMENARATGEASRGNEDAPESSKESPSTEYLPTGISSPPEGPETEKSSQEQDDPSARNTSVHEKKEAKPQTDDKTDGPPLKKQRLEVEDIGTAEEEARTENAPAGVNVSSPLPLEQGTTTVEAKPQGTSMDVDRKSAEVFNPSPTDTANNTADQPTRTEEVGDTSEQPSTTKEAVGGETATKDPEGAKNKTMAIDPASTEEAATPTKSANNATDEPTTTKEVGDTAGQPLEAEELGANIVADNPEETKAGESGVSKAEPTPKTDDENAAEQVPTTEQAGSSQAELAAKIEIDGLPTTEQGERSQTNETQENNKALDVGASSGGQLATSTEGDSNAMDVDTKDETNPTMNGHSSETKDATSEAQLPSAENPPKQSAESDRPEDTESRNETGKVRHDDDKRVGLVKNDGSEKVDSTNNPPKPKKNIRSKHMDPNILEFRRRIQFGCRDNDLASAMEAYEEAIASSIHLEAQSFYNLLNLCDGLEKHVHVGMPKPNTGDEKPEKVVRPVDHKTRRDYAFRLKEHMAKLKLPLNETAYTAIVKVLVRNKDYEKAELVLDESENVQQCRPKLRLYASLLTAYCEERYMAEALKCWLRITKQGLEISERESLVLMRCAIATGDVLVMQRVLSNIAEEVAVPSKDTVAAILEWFVSAHAVHTEKMRVPKHADGSQVRQLLDGIHEKETEPPPDMGPVLHTQGWEISSAVPIDTKIGMLQEGCLKNFKLKPVPLSARAWEEMTRMNEKIVLDGEVDGSTSKFQGGRKGKKRTAFSPEERKAQWQRFTEFLETKGSLDILIDAANVGYYKQNFGGAPKHVDYEQIDWIVQHFTRMGKRVLLVLHQRHFNPRLMPGKYKPIQEKWEREGILYKTPPGMNDDWFWLHAALKYKTLVLTNDEMRDHHFQMLAPRIFLRWKERHQVHFDFGDWEASGVNTSQGGRKVELVFPVAYSRRIQRVEDGLVVPLAKRGDENRFLDGVHVASDDEPAEETYLCIRPAHGTILR
jgi:pentatricopeptide repeat protein